MGESSSCMSQWKNSFCQRNMLHHITLNALLSLLTGIRCFKPLYFHLKSSMHVFLPALLFPIQKKCTSIFDCYSQ